MCIVNLMTFVYLLERSTLWKNMSIFFLFKWSQIIFVKHGGEKLKLEINIFKWNIWINIFFAGGIGVKILIVLPISPHLPLVHGISTLLFCSLQIKSNFQQPDFIHCFFCTVNSLTIFFVQLHTYKITRINLYKSGFFENFSF